ncbi:metal ABC transporter solute-binding protein, Zn/Mn family [Bartonella sp. DGB2]|uniref:metal ABC transporter solute-binding protein, Zn/Mn family n=1 Tax=Bartonella sp. DGB2 TaxID=3388426 RepID=UPI0039901CFF
MLNYSKKLIALSAFFLFPFSALSAQTQEPIKSVATFSILADIVKNVGGDKVNVISLVGPNMDAHIYEPTPADAQNIKQAQIIFTNGLGMEGFINRLISASGTKALVVVASKGVEALQRSQGHDHNKEHNNDSEHKHHHGKYDPHTWQSISNVKIYVKNIAAGLCQINANDCPTFKSNAKAYTEKLDNLNEKIKSEFASIPKNKRIIITNHHAFSYFAHEYGFTFLSPEGISTETEASAASVAKIIKQIKKQKAAALFVENISDPRLIEQISKEAGVKIGNTLYSDALSAQNGPASTYLDMMQYNAKQIVSAIEGK